MRILAKHISGLAFAIALYFIFVPAVQAKGAFGDDNFADFAGAEEVLDNEMDNQRGGFINVSGMLVAFTFSATASVNGVQVGQEFLITDQTAQAILNGESPAGLDPIIVQNSLDDANIVVNQVLDMDVIGAGQFTAMQSAATQAAFQSMMVTLY